MKPLHPAVIAEQIRMSAPSRYRRSEPLPKPVEGGGQETPLFRPVWSLPIYRPVREYDEDGYRDTGPIGG